MSIKIQSYCPLGFPFPLAPLPAPAPKQNPSPRGWGGEYALAELGVCKVQAQRVRKLLVWRESAPWMRLSYHGDRGDNALGRAKPVFAALRFRRGI